MATIAQAQQAGQLANGLLALQTFVAGLQAAVAAGSTVQGISITTGALQTISFSPPSGLSAPDSATLMNTLVSLANGLSSEWTTTLNGM